MEKIIEFRKKLREEALKKARIFAECVRKIGKVTVIVFGSYARGDFNVWSDIDVLVITDAALPPNPLKRLDMIEECLAIVSEIEPIILTINEFRDRLRKRDPAIIEAIDKGIVILDELKLEELVTRRC